LQENPDKERAQFLIFLVTLNILGNKETTTAYFKPTGSARLM